MTAKKKTNVFTLAGTIGDAILSSIPQAQLNKLDGNKQRQLLDAASVCAGQVVEVLDSE